MLSHRWLHIAAFVILIGVLTATLGARSIGSAVELTAGSVEIPEPAVLFAVGAMLVALAASARRVTRQEAGH